MNQTLNKQNAVKEFKVKSVAEFIATLNAMRIAAAGSGHYLYRGLASAAWEILSSAELRLQQERQKLSVKESGNLMLAPEETESVFMDASFLSMVAARLPVEPHNLQLYEDSCFCWENLMHKYELYVSDGVITEISTGTIPGQVKKRLALVEGIEVLYTDAKVAKFAKELLKAKVMRRKASNDAYHIAICCVFGVDYLLTTNMKDMANESRIQKLRKLAKKRGYKPPKILTPEQFIILYNKGAL